MRILLVSYYFPPFNSVGAIRPGKLARWFDEMGHDVQVLTCSNQPFPRGLPLEISAGRVHAVPAWSVNAPAEWLRGGRDKVARNGYGASSSSRGALGWLGRAYKSLAHWPDGQMGWVRAAINAGVTLAREHEFDVVYASAPPFSGLRVASAIATRASLPWVAELRDLWTDNHAYDAPAWRCAIERRWEESLLRTAAALVTVSAPMARLLARFGRPVWEIRNGCDAEDFDGLFPPAILAGERDVLTVVFTGNIYEAHYDVDTFCAGVAQARSREGCIRVLVAGRNDEALRSAAVAHGVSELFTFLKTVPRREALALQRFSDALLFFIWGSEAEGVYSAKLFEYANAGPPVLAVGPCNDVAALISEMRLGYCCQTADDVADAIDKVRLGKQRSGNYVERKVPLSVFSRSSQFEELASRLEDLLKHQTGART